MNICANNSISKNSKIFVSFCVLLLAALTAFWQLGTESMENHECYVSVVAMEMLENGDWVMPTYNGQLRLQKTPLSYWLVAGLSKITGRIDEFTARLPSAVFAFLSAAAILYFVNLWLTFRIAALSAAVWVTSLGYENYSHNTRPEMALTFFVLVCFLSFYSAIITNNRKNQIIYMLVFWISFGLANLAKGPAPLPIVLIPLFFYIAIFRLWGKIPKLLPVTGVIIFLVIVLPWPLAIAHRLDWDLTVWKHEFVDRFFGEFAPGNYPIYFYLLMMFAFVAPWGIFLLVALPAPFYKIWDKKRKVMLFLWLWFVVDLIFLTISGGKRKHYILPLMPAMAILIGIVVEDMAFVRRAYTQKFAKIFLLCHILLITVLAAAGMIYTAIAHPEFLLQALSLALIALAMAGGISISFAKDKPALACGFIFAGLCILTVCHISFSAPLSNNNYTKKFGLDIYEKVPMTDNLVAYRYVSPRAVHYFKRPIEILQDKSLVYQLYQQGDWILATNGDLKELEEDGRFRKAYYNENAEMRGRKENTRGALFHKSAPAVDDDMQAQRSKPHLLKSE
jgi:4-amino-4-deoxy-L-arabinose transferase-like glycosyltransferase